jgi:Plasmid recombination enzyme
VASSGHHNDRSRETLNADPARRDQNKVLIGDECNVRESVTEVIDRHGGLPRHDSVEAVEMLLTASPGYFLDERGKIDQARVDKFTERAVAFLKDPRSGGICVKATLHMDEHSPHVQAHKVPITPDGKLSAKHYFGSRTKLSEFQDLYFEYMRPLGLERGERGSVARHTDVKEFYSAITKDHRLRIDPQRLPDPPLLQTAKALKKYKEEVVRSVNEQVAEPLKVMHHQAMLTREEASKRERAEELAKEGVAAAQKQTAVIWEQYKVVDGQNRKLRQENKYLQGSLTKLQETLDQSRKDGQKVALVAEIYSRRIKDIPMEEVMHKLGYEGERRGSGDIVYLDEHDRVSCGIVDNRFVDTNNKVLARNSFELVHFMKNENEGVKTNRTQVFEWLADNFGSERACAALLVEREQCASEYLNERSLMKSREWAEQMRPMGMAESRGYEPVERQAPERAAEDRSMGRGDDHSDPVYSR